MMQIFVKNQYGRTFCLEVHESDKVLTVKKKLEKLQEVPEEAQRLIYAQVQLSDDKTLSYYNIQRENTLHMIERLKGGGAPMPVTLNDYSTNKYKEVTLVCGDSTYDCVDLGLNYRGTCRNTNCSSIDDKVVVQKGFGEISYSMDHFRTKCPNCNKKIEIEEIWMYKCTYYMEFMKDAESEEITTPKVTTKESIKLDNEGKTENFKYFIFHVSEN